MSKKSNKNKIAIIGFDCMVTNPKNLKPLISKWKNGGPVLPVEMTRVSSDGRLTPVLDSRSGSDIKTMFAVFKTTDLNRAILEVAKRQGVTNNHRVGYVELTQQLVNADCLQRQPESCRKIALWARENGFSAVVWNGLGVKFKDAINIPFTYENASNYLKSLPRNRRTKAMNYINSLPKFVDTNLRKYLKENN